jgi:hypothetical protein
MEAEGNTPIVAVRQYNWRGNHVGYLCENASNPAGNDHFGRIQAGIAAGTHREIEPEIKEAIKTFTIDARLSGYETPHGFIPIDPSNRLFQILDEAIKAGICQIKEPPAEKGFYSDTEAVIVCVIFNRAWPNLGGRFERIFPYRSAEDVPARDLRIKLRNLPNDTDAMQDKDLIFKEYGIDIFKDPIGSPIQTGILEIHIPLRELSKLFRTEHRRLEPHMKSLVEDQLAQHYAQSGRSPSSGPAVDWLIPRAGWWLGRLVAGLANTVTRTYVREYGGTAPGYVWEDVLARHALIIARGRGGENHVCGIGNSGGARLNLQGTWPDGAATLEITNPETYPGGHRRQVLWRIRQMTEAGFGVEALALLSSYFEVTLREALILAVGYPKENVELATIISRLGHRRRLDLLERLIEAELDQVLSFPNIASLVPMVRQIYGHRNDYLHDLELPQGEAWLSIETERQIEEWITLFTEYGTPPSWSVILLRLYHSNGDVRQFLKTAAAEIVQQADDLDMPPSSP